MKITTTEGASPTKERKGDSMIYDKIYKGVNGGEYKLWKQKDSYGNLMYGFNKKQYDNWYNWSGKGWFTAKDRDDELKIQLSED